MTPHLLKKYYLLNIYFLYTQLGILTLMYPKLDTLNYHLNAVFETGNLK